MSAAAPKVAAVTGGSAGIGKAICEDLLAQGYEVVSLARRKAEIDHPKMHSLEVDLADRAATGQAVRELVERFAPTTIVHNAGVIRAALLPEVKLDDLDALVDLHLGCAIQLVQGALPAMRAQRFGRVVLLSSRAALGLATRTSYSATKAGMLGMARTWALELAADGITVNVVAPGPIRTDMFYDVVEAGSEKERALAASVPVKRLGRIGRRGTRRAFLRRAREQFRHRPGAVRVRRHQRRQPGPLVSFQRPFRSVQKHHLWSIAMKVLNRIRTLAAVAAGLGALSAASAWAADLKVGFITSLSGPVSSLGIPYEKGMKAALAYKADLGGRKIQLVQLDDASDPTTAARNARKMIDEDKVDVIIGTAGSPGALAIAGVARETKTPLISIANANLPGEEGAWMVTLPQPAPLMVSAVVERMKKSGVKTVGYIGFSDAWGDLVYGALQKSAEPAGIKIVSNERYARGDASVTGQVLKIVALRPDAVITGTSGTPGALPYLALSERGYKGQIYGMHALINPDFVRVGGASVEGLLAPTGPVIVAEQLPNDNPIRKVSMDFRAAYQKANGAPPTDAFSAYTFDAWLVYLDAAQRALATKAEPGTPQFRLALRDAIVSTKELVGTHSVYNFKPTERYGSDDRSRVVVKLEKGQWKLVP
ncbi:3-oxoacyl-[acyl-carrier-protein] reductase FabG [compost metagenome]